MPARVVAAAATASLCVLLVLEACASRSNPVGPGGECFLATDCAPGLVCVEQSSGARVCSDDLSRVAGEPPEEEQGEDAAADGAANPDTSTPDTGGPQPDTGGPQPDTGGPQPDTGGPPPDDSGTDT